MQKVSIRRRTSRRKTQKQKLQLALALLLMVGGLGTILWMALESQPGYPAAPTPATMQAGEQAIDFTLPSLDGTPVTLSDYQGQVVLVNLWATWCPPCRAEMPDLNAFYETYRDQGLTVLAVNQQERKETAQRFIESNNFSFPVLLDADGAMGNQYLARTLPMTFVIDENGRIRHVQRGLITRRELDRYVVPLLEG